MSIKPPFTAVEVRRAASGFYEGHSVEIALLSKGIMVALVIWALVWPANANSNLSSLNWSLLEGFNAFYIIIVGLFAFFLAVVAILPQTGKRKMGRADEAPEFSNFSWFSMMFGAGLGVGLMVFATAEPLGLWGSNPETVSGAVAPNSQEALTSAYRYTFLHYGFHAWAIYVVTGLSLAYYAYTRDMPLTIRSALTPLLGRYVNGFIGHLVDVLGVVATILGVSVTIGFWCEPVYRWGLCDYWRQLVDGYDRRRAKARHCGLDCGAALHHGSVDYLSRVRGGPRGEIPVQPQFGIIADFVVHLCAVRLICFRNDDLRNGLCRLYLALRIAQLWSLWPAIFRCLCHGTSGDGQTFGRRVDRRCHQCLGQL